MSTGASTSGRSTDEDDDNTSEIEDEMGQRTGSASPTSPLDAAGVLTSTDTDTSSLDTAELLSLIDRRNAASEFEQVLEENRRILVLGEFQVPNQLQTQPMDTTTASQPLMPSIRMLENEICISPVNSANPVKFETISLGSSPDSGEALREQDDLKTESTLPSEVGLIVASALDAEDSEKEWHAPKAGCECLTRPGSPDISCLSAEGQAAAWALVELGMMTVDTINICDLHAVDPADDDSNGPSSDSPIPLEVTQIRDVRNWKLFADISYKRDRVYIQSFLPPIRKLYLWHIEGKTLVHSHYLLKKLMLPLSLKRSISGSQGWECDLPEIERSAIVYQLYCVSRGVSSGDKKLVRLLKFPLELAWPHLLETSEKDLFEFVRAINRAHEFLPHPEFQRIKDRVFTIRCYAPDTYRPW